MPPLVDILSRLSAPPSRLRQGNRLRRNRGSQPIPLIFKAVGKGRPVAPATPPRHPRVKGFEAKLFSLAMPAPAPWRAGLNVLSRNGLPRDAPRGRPDGGSGQALSRGRGAKTALKSGG